MYKELLKLARENIKANLTGSKIEVKNEIKEKYREKQACFVTLTIDGELRGCIGSLEAHQELWKDVLENSIHAAFNDPRFVPLSIKELDKIHIEISILTKPEKLGIGKEVFDKIDKEMGIILKRGFRSSTFLPQVWEQISEKKDFLEHLSRKAGLPKDEWKESLLLFYRVEKVEE